ncbi:hypothetical protein ACTXT7_011382 [Hymenolepis weldensis]
MFPNNFVTNLFSNCSSSSHPSEKKVYQFMECPHFYDSLLASAFSSYTLLQTVDDTERLCRSFSFLSHQLLVTDILTIDAKVFPHTVKMENTLIAGLLCSSLNLANTDYFSIHSESRIGVLTCQ